uniref:Uncharacterized protein n=1 Tax=Solibacter usitatus (strain Ellin6076) TaxID=234267 RepID=Q01PQ7_SOLUE
MAALTLPGSLLAQPFHAKASAEGPVTGTHSPAEGKGDAAFPSLLEGLVGEHAAAASGSAADALAGSGEKLPAGQKRNSGNHTRGKFTELERLIARTGRVRLPEKDASQTDIVSVRSTDGEPAVPEVKQAAQRVAAPVVTESQTTEAGAPAEQTSLPGLRIAEPPTQLVHHLPATVRATTLALGGSRDTQSENKVETLKVPLTAQSIGTAPPEQRAAAVPGVAIPERAHLRTPKLTAAAGAHRRATGAALPDLPSVDKADVLSEGGTAEDARPEPDGAVPLPRPALRAAAEQPAIEWDPQAGRLAAVRSAANEAARPSARTSTPLRAARQSTVTNPERHQQTGAAGDQPAPPPLAELKMPVSAAPTVVPEKPQQGVSPVAGAPPDGSPDRSLSPSVLATGVKPASPSVSDELPPAGHLDARLKSTVSPVAPVADQSPDSIARPSTRNADNLAPGGAKVRTLSIASTDRGEVAFEVELRSIGKQPPTIEGVTNERVMPPAAPASVKTVAPEPAAIEAVAGQPTPAPREEVAQIAEVPAQGGDTNRPATGERDKKQATPERSPRPAPPVDSHSESATALPGVKVSNWTQSGMSRQEGMPEPAAPPDAAPARPDETSAARMDAKAEVQAASAHEIKLEVSGGERRVEVRLSERGGEVRIAVRTPDSHLAGTLRENLPELTSRFAESGLRSEIWRPGGSLAGESRHAQEAALGNPAQDAESQSRGNGGEQQRDAQERQQRSFQEPKNDKEKGKDFAWLMSSLR